MKAFLINLGRHPDRLARARTRLAAAGVEAVVAAGYDISSAAAALERIYFEK